MNIEKILPIVEDARGTRYDLGIIKLVIRKRGTISADHEHPEAEVNYFISGQVKLTVGTESQIITAPVKVIIPLNVYHKIEAVTDFILLYER
ncbi:MAG: cupin domain-containing protein [Candidatus Kerfeldbacteria bacterium]|nr:cupin domain-containing protein [Candidatus Kerfeldbacteria bacterium]